MKRRVVVTGMGIVVPGSITKEELWKRVSSGESAVEAISLFDTAGLQTTIAGEVKNFQPENFIETKHLRRLDRSATLALCASQFAIQDARLDPEKVSGESFGIFEGTALGPMRSLFEQHRNFLSEGCGRANPRLLISCMNGGTSGAVAQRFHVHGPCTTISDGSASSTTALGMGYRYIKHGMIDMALVGGTETPICPEIIAAFGCAHLLSRQNSMPHQAMKPFDQHRDGFVLGEGSTFLIIEELGHAIRRETPILAEILGFGETTDAYHPTSPDPGGTWIAQAMEMAIRESEISPNAIGYVNAHGTATLANDLAETLATKKVFGDRVYRIPMSSSKPLTGHLLGACGALEAVITVLTIQHQFLPPTINLKVSDEQCDLDYVPLKGRNATIEYAISNNYSFSGRNASLIFKKYS